MWGLTWDELTAMMPDSVRRSLLPWEWSRDQLWALALPARSMPLQTLQSVFQVPLWRGEDGTPFATRPDDVLAAPERYPSQFDRMLQANLAYPVDITRWRGAWIVLDGVHRLLKAAHLGLAEVAAREVPCELYAAFAVTPQAVSPSLG